MLKMESPWVRRLPGEYILDHISFSTQPVEESPDDKNGLSDLLASIDGIENVLCFSTDYLADGRCAVDPKLRVGVYSCEVQEGRVMVEVPTRT
ncbi:MAG TPA: hypothetical protein VFX16_24940 [Pseudonocardiaceae bacterium]|nr:hypothetical protein [Pseudonocardiaceae bacterium]